MSDQKFNDVRNSAQPFTICNMFERLCDLMVATMLARANIRFSFEKDDIVTSNLGMEFESHFKLISPYIGPIHLCLDEDTPKPIRVKQTEYGLVDMPPVPLHDLDGNPIHVMSISVPMELFHEKMCNFICAIAPNAELLPLDEVYKASIPYFERLKPR